MGVAQSDTFGIGPVLDMLIKVFTRYPHIDKVVLFGSRARGDYKRTSDIDLCIYGDMLTKRCRYDIRDEIEELETFYSFDVVFFDELEKDLFIKSIIKDQITIYDKGC